MNISPATNMLLTAFDALHRDAVEGLSFARESFLELLGKTQGDPTAQEEIAVGLEHLDGVIALLSGEE